jgi:hypothetical protein
MGQGRFLNQKLGKRTSRKVQLDKVKLTAEPPAPKKWPQREQKSKRAVP